MINPIAIINLIGLVFETSQNVSRQVFNHLSSEDVGIIETNSISDDRSYNEYLRKTNRKKAAMELLK